MHKVDIIDVQRFTLALTYRRLPCNLQTELAICRYHYTTMTFRSELLPDVRGW